MIEEDPLRFWRMHDQLSVRTAAILMCGGDPSPYGNGADQLGFDAAFSALKQAVLRGDIEATLSYSDPTLGTWPSPYDSQGTTTPSVANTSPTKDREPDWDKTQLDVTSVKAWISSKGIPDSFFVTSVKREGPQPYMDPSHPHFSPELAMAVETWCALAPNLELNTGTRKEIEAWLETNWKDEWLGPQTNNAMERISMVVNWNKKGGASSTPG